MNWDVHLQLEILLSTANNGQIVDKVTARIHVLETSGVRGGWKLENSPVRGVPEGGSWRWVAGSGGDLTLLDAELQPFARLTQFIYPPGSSAQGAVYLSPNRRPAQTGEQWRGTGKWSLAKDKPQNTPEALLDSLTWANFIHGFGRIGQLTEWQMVSSRGFSVTKSFAKFGGEIAHGGVQLQNLKRPNSAPVWMNYTSIGMGYMLKGAGGSGGTEDFPTWFGAVLTLGTLPTDTPLELEALEGFCQIVDLSAGLVESGGIPLNRGGGASLLMVIFGVPGAGLALGAYKAAGLVVGPAVGTGTSGKSAGATLQAGRIHIER